MTAELIDRGARGLKIPATSLCGSGGGHLPDVATDVALVKATGTVAPHSLSGGGRCPPIAANDTKARFSYGPR